MQTFYSALPWIIRQLGLGRTESRKYEISYGYQIGPSYAQAPDRRAQARIINEGTQCVSFSTTRNKINVTGAVPVERRRIARGGNMVNWVKLGAAASGLDRR